MWDLTVQDDHDFYVVPAATMAGGQTQAYVGAEAPVLVHNGSCPDIAAAASAAAKNAPRDATMTSVARIKGTDIGKSDTQCFFKAFLS